MTLPNSHPPDQDEFGAEPLTMFPTSALVPERSQLLAGGWRQLHLGDVAKVQSGFPFRSSDWVNAGVPVVKIQNVRMGRVSLESCSFVSEEVAHNASRFRLRRGDVLITMSGEIGSVGIYRSDEHAVLNQRVGRVETLDPTQLLPLYLAYVLQLPETKKIMEGAAYGAAQPNISPSVLAAIEVTIPDLVTQFKITSLLDQIDELIDNKYSAISVLRQTKELLMPRLISGEVDVSDLELGEFVP